MTPVSASRRSGSAMKCAVIGMFIRSPGANGNAVDVVGELAAASLATDPVGLARRSPWRRSADLGESGAP